MFKMIVQMHRRQEVTTHATIDEARGRLADICAAQRCRIEGDETTGEFIHRDRNGNDDPQVTWNYGGYLIIQIDPEALVYVVEHGNERDEFLSDAEARHFQATAAPGSSRYAELAAA